MKFQTMVCLVGENPLPIYLGIKEFADKGATIALVSSLTTQPKADAIETTCGEIYKFKHKHLKLPFSPPAVDTFMQKIFDEYPDAALNYTGGTKVMSGFGLHQWILKAALDQAFYLDEGERRFHFGNLNQGWDVSVALSLDELIQLHAPTKSASAERIEMSADELNSVYNQLKSKKNRVFRYGMPDLEDGFSAGDRIELGRFLGLIDITQGEWANYAATFDKGNHRGSDLEQILKCASGGWFEQLIELIVRCLPAEFPLNNIKFNGVVPAQKLIQDENVLANQILFMDNRKEEFESDLLVIYGHRLCYLSITTSSRPQICKSKMFEAKYRAQQIGGGLVKSCVITLYNEFWNPVDKRPQNLKQTCLTSTGNDPRHTMFDGKDVAAWMRGQTDSLRKFLTE